MWRRKRIRILLCTAVSIVVLAGSLGFGLAIRHRHEAGDHAHSHGGSSHSHSHAHPHAHSHDHSPGHSHSHRHSHTHARSTGHSHQHSEKSNEGGESNLSEDGGNIEAHIHVSFFGFELTLPDFIGGEPAPLVADDESPGAEPFAGDIVRLPFSPGFPTLVHLFNTLTAVSPDRVRIRSNDPPIVLMESVTAQYQGLDAARPLLPPPKPA